MFKLSFPFFGIGITDFGMFIVREILIGSLYLKSNQSFDRLWPAILWTLTGLVTLDEMKAKQDLMIKEREKQLAQKEKQARLVKEEERKQKNKDGKKVTTSSNREGGCRIQT